jgi:hypothetical protein
MLQFYHGVTEARRKKSLLFFALLSSPAMMDVSKRDKKIPDG